MSSHQYFCSNSPTISWEPQLLNKLMTSLNLQDHWTMQTSSDSTVSRNTIIKTTAVVWPTKCWDCDCVEDLNATVGNSFLRYFIHLSTTSLGTRSIAYMNNWVSIYYKSLPILFKTRISFLLLPAIRTASSTYRIITSALLWESTLLMG